MTCYLSVLGAYWLWSAVHYGAELRSVSGIGHFYRNKLGVSDGQLGMMTWAEVRRRGYDDGRPASGGLGCVCVCMERGQANRLLPHVT